MHHIQNPIPNFKACAKLVLSNGRAMPCASRSMDRSQSPLALSPAASKMLLKLGAPLLLLLDCEIGSQ